MALLISDEVVQQTQWSEDDFRMELAIFLYKRERMTLAQAADCVGMPGFLFQKELAKRKIPVNYSAEDLREDVETFQRKLF